MTLKPAISAQNNVDLFILQYTEIDIFAARNEKIYFICRFISEKPPKLIFLQFWG
jgi:hypothetical protein